MIQHTARLRRLALLAGLAVASAAPAQTGSVAPCPLELYKVPQWAKDGDTLRQRLEADLKFAVQGGESELGLAILCAGAAAGLPFAETMLGGMTAEGRIGLKKDAALGRQWLERAAAHGDALAQYLLSNMYFSGQGGPVRIKEGMDHLRSAAHGGNVEAKYHLGAELITGSYVPRDLQAARRWLQEAANAGHPRAPAMLRELEQVMGVK